MLTMVHLVGGGHESFSGGVPGGPIVSGIEHDMVQTLLPEGNLIQSLRFLQSSRELHSPPTATVSDLHDSPNANASTTPIGRHLNVTPPVYEASSYSNKCQLLCKWEVTVATAPPVVKMWLVPVSRTCT